MIPLFSDGSRALQDYAQRLGASTLMRPAWRRIADAVAPESGRLLDINCGSGWLCIEAASRHPDLDVVGIDVSPRAIRAALRNRQSRLNCAFCLMDASHVVFPDQSFDVVTSVGAAQTWRDPEAILSEARRVLKPGRTMFLYDPDPDAELSAEWVPTVRDRVPTGLLRWACLRHHLRDEARVRITTVGRALFETVTEDRHGFFRRWRLTRG